MEEMAHALGYTYRSYWLWEHGDIVPDQSVWKKIILLVKKEAKKRFKEDFLMHLCSAGGIKTYVQLGDGNIREKTEEEILEEIETNARFAQHLKDNLFAKKSPELKKLPFREGFEKYCRDEMDHAPSMLLNMIPKPAEVTKIRKEKRRKKISKMDISNKTRKIIAIHRAREPSRKRRNSSCNSKSGESDDASSDCGDGEPPAQSRHECEGLSRQAIDEFKRNHFKEFKEKISDNEAVEMGKNLLALLRVIYRPIDIRAKRRG